MAWGSDLNLLIIYTTPSIPLPTGPHSSRRGRRNSKVPTPQTTSGQSKGGHDVIILQYYIILYRLMSKPREYYDLVEGGDEHNILISHGPYVHTANSILSICEGPL